MECLHDIIRILTDRKKHSTNINQKHSAMRHTAYDDVSCGVCPMAPLLVDDGPCHPDRGLGDKGVGWVGAEACPDDKQCLTDEPVDCLNSSN